MSEDDGASQASAVVSFQMDNTSEDKDSSFQGPRQRRRGSIGMSASSSSSLDFSEDSQMTGSDTQTAFKRDVISL